MKENPVIQKMKEDAMRLQQQLEGGVSLDKKSASAADIINKNHGAKSNTDIKICGKAYKIKKYTLREWCYTTPYLGKRFSPALLAFDGTPEGITRGLLGLSMELEDGVFEEAVELIISTTTLDGELITLDTFESPAEMLEVVMNILKVNYEDVFMKGWSAVLTALGNVTKAAETLL